MKALWAAGPDRGKPVHLRGAFVAMDVHEGNPLTAETEVWPVREIQVGDRRWRVIVPADWTLDQALLALIDADPADARQAEVSP